MSELRAGDLLWEVDPIRLILQPSLVRSTTVQKGRGLFNPHTLSGTVIVNNVVALSFTEILPRSLTFQTFLTFPLALLSWFCPSVKVAQQLNSIVLQALSK